ncbi:MAG: hypothetical protein V4808_01435 [Pseudomonadota bacterium]
MDQILYVLAIMGCGDDSLACQQARVEPVRYTSYAACQQAMPAALNRNTDVDYPVIAAACQRQTPQSAEAQPPRPTGR